MAVGFAVSAVTGVDTSYWVIVLAMFFLGGGLGLVQAPATEAIMGSLPPAKAGVGSAVNDTARELGSTLGVAIVGSVFSSIYASKLGDALAGTPVPAEAIDDRQGVGRRRPRSSPSRPAPPPARRPRTLVQHAVNHSFVAGWHAGSWVCFGVVLLGALVAWRWLPAQSGRTSPDATTRSLVELSDHGRRTTPSA